MPPRRIRPSPESPENRSKRTRTKAATSRAVNRWRREVRPRALRAAAAATQSIGWSPNLLRLLIEELYVDDSLAELLGTPLDHVPKRRYPQAVALALMLRHSWRADDLTCIMERLGVKGGRRPKA